MQLVVIGDLTRPLRQEELQAWQRLVRVLCPFCKAPANFPEEDLAEVGFPIEHIDKVLKPVGCDSCRHTGYQGRCAIIATSQATNQKTSSRAHCPPR